MTLRSRGPSKAPHARISGLGPATHCQSFISQSSYTPTPVPIFVDWLPTETGPSSFQYHIHFGNAYREEVNHSFMLPGGVYVKVREDMKHFSFG